MELMGWFALAVYLLCGAVFWVSIYRSEVKFWTDDPTPTTEDRLMAMFPATLFALCWPFIVPIMALWLLVLRWPVRWVWHTFVVPVLERLER
jgi:hypothetical protein